MEESLFDIPQSQHDQAQDNWERLLATAGITGGDFSVLVREVGITSSF